MLWNKKFLPTDHHLWTDLLKVNMLHIIQYVSFPYWSYIETQLRGDKLSLDIDDLNEDRTEQIRKQGRPVGTSGQPSQDFKLLDACNGHECLLPKTGLKRQLCHYGVCVTHISYQLLIYYHTGMQCVGIRLG